MQATLKKKMIKEGLLDEKGKANERTPSDWHSKYRELTHYGPSSGSANGTGAAGSETAGDGGGGGDREAGAEESGAASSEKKKKKKKREKDDDEDQ